MPTVDELFNEYGPQRAISPTRRRTLRQKADIRRGIHPATRIALANNGESCRTCSHSTRSGYRTRTYWKCELLPITFGAGTDIRLWWPACLRWEPRE